MRQKKFWFNMNGILAVLALALILPAGAVAASKYKVLHRWGHGDGKYPNGGLIFDAAGNLYGTTSSDNLFKLTPNSDGSWAYSLLHRFTGGADGGFPGAGLIFDADGNLYGTTTQGGAYGHGTVFKLTPSSGGKWKETVIHEFAGYPSDGAFPRCQLIFDAAGNLYGTALGGGSANFGVVFKLTPSNGTWTGSVLYSFCSLKNCADGDTPSGGVVFDAAGNLYGVTPVGGDSAKCPRNDGCGTVFELTPNSNGTCTESVLHNFTNGADGGFPVEGVIFDTTGNLYGAAGEGGNLSCNPPNGCGTVFKLTPHPNGTWTESVLHTFAVSGPNGGQIFDAAGNLYGTTAFGGSAGDGTVFKLAPGSGGRWVYSVVSIFFGNPASYPNPYLVLDKAGNLYGTTHFCGNGKCNGVAFEITP
jgi:uncharacterized repeat protein (TIGR03803 family)